MNCTVREFLQSIDSNLSTMAVGVAIPWEPGHYGVPEYFFIDKANELEEVRNDPTKYASLKAYLDNREKWLSSKIDKLQFVMNPTPHTVTLNGETITTHGVHITIFTVKDSE